MAKAVPKDDLPSGMVPMDDMPSTDRGFDPFKMIANAPRSLYKNTVGGLYEAVTNPIDTLTGLSDIVAGGVYNALPQSVQQGLDVIERSPYNPLGNPQAQQRAVNVANIVGQDYKKTYTTKEGFKQTLQEDPFRIMGDLSMGLYGAAPLVTRVAPAAGRVVSTAANLTNPMTTLLKTTKAIAPVVGSVGANVLGLTTGVGPETVKTAFKSGLEGSDAFLKNMRKQVEKTQVLDDARQALQNMRTAKSADYKTGIATTAADTAQLDFAPITQKFNDLYDTLYQGKRLKVGADELKKINEVSDVLNEWRTDPTSHTPIGLDALKQRIDTIYPDSPMQKQAQRVIGQTRKAVYDTIVAQSPDYAKTMSNYEKSLALEKEIETALSIGTKSSADTALRKLTSLSRNNVNANYGYRSDLAKVLEEQGGKSLFPAIAGQSMNSSLPRGLAPQIAGATAIPGVIQSFMAGVTPTSLVAAPFFSPRIVGEGLYGAGSLARMAKQSGLNQNLLAPSIATMRGVAQKVPMTAEQARIAAMLAGRAGNYQGLLD